MARLKLVNVGLKGADQFEPFHIGGYSFYPAAHRHRRDTVWTTARQAQEVRRHKQNACVEYAGRQEASLLFEGMYLIDAFTGERLRGRLFLEDMLLLGSLLTGRNWALYSHRHWPTYPVTACNGLVGAVEGPADLARELESAVERIRDRQWREQFCNGLHLKMLLNSSNVFVLEDRFLAEMVIWEFLYARICGREDNDLRKILKAVLDWGWPGRVNEEAFPDGKGDGKPGNIYHVLRNQLAHSGRLPIDRPYAEDWMRDIPMDKREGGHQVGLLTYFRFFSHLTEAVAMRTLRKDVSPAMRIFDFDKRLDSYLTTGRL